MSKMKALSTSLSEIEAILHDLANHLVAQHVAFKMAQESKDTTFIMGHLHTMTSSGRLPNGTDLLCISDIATQLLFLDQEITSLIKDNPLPHN